jgi:SAM-dependent methyltransferase
MNPRPFVERHLPPLPARVLEVGCGRGELARRIATLGYDVVAIDPDAPPGDLFQPVSLEQFADPHPFDAVVAIRSLHHIHDLGDALDRIGALLAPDGRFIVHEHAWERLDDRTARWYLERRRSAGPGSPGSLEGCLADWRDDHADLHTSAAMRRELDRRFAQCFFTWTPYLHGELGGIVTEDEEESLIRAGAIQATGFCYVGGRQTEPTGNGRGL